jgi:hypothetical protein
MKYKNFKKNANFFPAENWRKMPTREIITLTPGRCPEIDCNATSTSASSPRARALQDPQAEALLQPTDDGALMASYSVFVLEPGEQVGQSCTFILDFYDDILLRRVCCEKTALKEASPTL